MSSSSPLNLSIAALQSRRRSRLAIGLGVAAVLVLFTVALFLYVPPPESIAGKAAESEPAATDHVSAKQNSPKVLSQPDRIQEQNLPESVTRGLAVLRSDSVYGPLVRELEQELKEQSRLTPNQERQLAAALAEKVSNLDRALTQAMLTNNPNLIATLSQSKFVQDYALDQLPNWNWTVTPTFGRYESASVSLSDAEAIDDHEGIIRSLESIQKITGFRGYDSKILELKESQAAAYEAMVKAQILSYMTDYDYARVLDAARAHQTLVASDVELKNIVHQAEIALSKYRRDQLYDAAMQQASADDWEAAVQTLSSIPADMRDNAVDEMAETGRNIITTKQTIKSLSDRPERLTDAYVEKYAMEQIKYGKTLAPLSSSLTSMIEDLSKHLSDAATTITVNITSDSRATILIPRLGFIEPTSKKVLNLQRSKYKFIVRCEGVADVIETLDLTSRPINEPIDIRLACES